uniref:Ig-like domain-containing protein n=1 Tax=Amphilophus citrinellus TaxID=61819 RepID=A0A3Q0SYY7_AMPCI
LSTWNHLIKLLLMSHVVFVVLSVCQVEVEEGKGVEFVQLPFKTTGDLSNAQVEWWRYEPEPPMTVHKYQNGPDQTDEQNQFYRDRTKMNEDLLKSGDLSLTLKCPTDRDTGKYICRVEAKGMKRKKTVLLRVISQYEYRTSDLQLCSK